MGQKIYDTLYGILYSKTMRVFVVLMVVALCAKFGWSIDKGPILDWLTEPANLTILMSVVAIALRMITGESIKEKGKKKREKKLKYEDLIKN